VRCCISGFNNIKIGKDSIVYACKKINQNSKAVLKYLMTSDNSHRTGSVDFFLDQIFEIEKNPIPQTKGSLKNKRSDQHWLKPATVQTRNGYMPKNLCSLFIKGRVKKSGSQINEDQITQSSPF
jgi:hypothetical protein